MDRYRDRYHAGQKLAEAMGSYRGLRDAIVLGIPRGGVPVAFELAKSLHMPLDVFMVRKLGVPGQEELAMGAISSGGGQVLNLPLIDALGIDRHTLEAVASRESQVLARREALYRGTRGPLDLQNKQLILVDDGLATGTTMRAGIQALRHLRPMRIIVAVPVAPLDACLEVQHEADEFICLARPEPFFAVGEWYHDFSQVEDAEVCHLLRSLGTAGPHELSEFAAPWGEAPPAS